MSNVPGNAPDLKSGDPKVTHEKLVARFKEIREKLTKSAKCSADCRAALVKAESDHKAASSEYMAITIALAEHAAGPADLEVRSEPMPVVVPPIETPNT